MTTELTKAAQQALHAFDADDDFAVSMAMDAIRAALTQRPAALQPGASNEATTQAQGDSMGDVQVDQGRVRHADSRVGSTVSELTQRPAAQTEREAFEAWTKASAIRADLGAWDAWQARASLPAPQQATPALQAVCRYISDVLAGDASSGEKHIARTIMHLLPLEQAVSAQQATPPQQAAGEPVGEPPLDDDDEASLCSVIGMLDRIASGQTMTSSDRLFDASVRPRKMTIKDAQAIASPAASILRKLLNKLRDVTSHPAPGVPAKLPSAYATSTQPRTMRSTAPGVPEVDDLAQFIRRIDGKHSMGAGALAEHICDWLAAAQAKGGR